MNTSYWQERRRAALQEAQAIEAWLKGRIDETALQRELRRAEMTRLRCCERYQRHPSQDTPPVRHELSEARELPPFPIVETRHDVEQFAEERIV